MRANCKKWLAGMAVSTAAWGAAATAAAADWSDTYIGYRYGTDFAEPYVNEGIQKHIVNLGHSSGYKYGTNFFNLDMLDSDSKNTNAQEAYVVYRHTLDFSKILGKSLAIGPARSFGFTLGFDWNTKTGDSYQSRKRMWVFGPTVMLDVPGFLNVGLFMLRESNHPASVQAAGRSRYSYDAHWMLNLAWGIPISSSGFSFEGYLNWIAAKGKNEFGGKTSAEFNIDAMVMYDLSRHVGAKPKTFRLGVEYQYWRNKFGNPKEAHGSLARTPMVRGEYHF
jgi:nucleoside-specific outer membrane channel protein Tsx